MRRLAAAPLAALTVACAPAPIPRGPIAVAAPPAIADQPAHAPGAAARRPGPPPPSPYAPLLGWWRETWAAGSGREGGERDQLEISLPGRLVIWCPDKPHYRFDEIDFDGERLDLRLIDARDPQDPYVVVYELDLSPDGRRLVGRAKTNRSTTVNVEWSRVER